MNEIPTITSAKTIEFARDVLKQIDSLNITRGYYFKFTPRFVDLMRVSPDESAQKHIDVLKECQVCAKGALCLTFIEKYNNVKVEDTSWFSGDGLYKLLHEFFSKEQLDKIEAAFECWSPLQVLSYNEENDVGNYEYRQFGVIPAKTRFRTIMETIIENEGVFVPDYYIGAMLEILNQHSA